MRTRNIMVTVIVFMAIWAGIGFLSGYAVGRSSVPQESYAIIEVPPGMELTVQPILSGRLYTPEELERGGTD